MTASSKYRNKKTVVDGITFDSKKEAARYSELKLLEKAGIIKYLELQPKIKLEVAGIKIVYGTGHQVRYHGDFRYWDCDKKHFVVEDTKGVKTPAYRLKKAILRAMGIDIVES
jgi:hypothetical protein